jgi:hypothetical protein
VRLGHLPNAPLPPLISPGEEQEKLTSFFEGVICLALQKQGVQKEVGVTGGAYVQGLGK